MKKLFFLICLIVVVVPALAPVEGSQTGAGATAAPDVNRGQALYNKYGCWECHGYTASTGNAPALVISPLSATGFLNYIRNPRTTGMPTFSTKIVPDSEVADIYAFVKSNKRPSEAKDIPLLQQIMNEK
jgi:mono/diheme cytochrome c family protein